METRQRYLSIDLLKALGILYVIVLHQVIWFVFMGDGDLVHIRFPEGYAFAYYIVCRGLHVLGLQIPLLAGATFYLSLRSKKVSWNSLLKRIVALMSLGFLMNCLAWGFSDSFYIEDIFDWDVLQFIALSMFVSYVLLKIFPFQWGIIGLVFLWAISLIFSDRFPWPHFQDRYFYAIFMGDASGENYWPFFPWFSLFASGVLIGEVMASQSKKKLNIFMLIGVVFLVASVFSGEFFVSDKVPKAWGPNLFKPSPLFVLGIVGFSLLVLPAVHLSLRQYQSLARYFKKSILIYFAQGILWIYIVTTILGYNLNVHFIENQDLNFKEAMVVFSVILFVNLVVSYLIGRVIWCRKQVFYEEA